MYYQIKPLKPNLIYIRWLRHPHPGTSPELTFVSALRILLENAPDTLYFLSDLRAGRIMDVRLLQQLAQLTEHPRWGGGTAFSHDSISRIFVNIYARFAGTILQQREIWDEPEEALAYLESLCQGITDGVDWAAVLSDDGSQVR